jgi:CubicO group peptidase (beta-lactamase class C family)
VDELVREAMERQAVPGVSAAAAVDGRLAWARGWGVRTAGRPDPVTPATMFQAGSISKPVAALGALRLVADGRLELDADVSDVLVGWRVPPSDGWQPRVTVRQLLSHTGGLTVHGFPGYARNAAVPTLVQVLDGAPPANTPAVRATTMPGLQFSYSGGGYCVLQQLLIDLTGREFSELLRDLVLEPLGMRDSGYEQPLPQERWGQAASGHRIGGAPVHGDWHVYPEMAAAGLWTTPSDLLRFAAAVQQAAAGADDAIIPRPLAEELLTPHATNQAIGLGLFLQGEGRTRRFEHGGDDQGFVALLTAYVELGLGAVVMTNSDSWPVIEPLLDAIARAHEWPDFLAPPREPTGAAPDDLDGLEGAYETEDGRRLRVAAAGDRLRLVLEPQPALDLYPAAEGGWFATALELEVRFPEEGRLVVHQRAAYVQPVEARKVEEAPGPD